MTSILKAALISAIFTGFAAQSLAWDMETTHPMPSAITMIPDSGGFVLAEPSLEFAPPLLPANAKVGIAHIHNGEMMIGLSSDVPRWSELGINSDITLNHITPAAYFNALPRLAVGEGPSENVMDEIRLAAIDSGLSHVLLYKSRSSAEGEVLLVDNFTGNILGTVNGADTDQLTAELQNLMGGMMTSARTT